jgi:hypothetical protein
VKPEAMNRLTKLAKAATIVFSSETTALSLYDAYIDGNYSNAFTGNRSKLKIKKVSNLDDLDIAISASFSWTNHGRSYPHPSLVIVKK